MSNSKSIDPVGGFLFLIFAILFSFMFGVGVGESGAWDRIEQMRKEAVRLGHAEYVAADDGESVWQWKESE